jgi:hypothetical protein
MRVMVITSCTGTKAQASPEGLTWEDFSRGEEHIARREADLTDLLTPAADLYTGEQHKRLMRGVRAATEAGIALDLRILSAGYGLVPTTRRLAPYECTYQGLRLADVRQRAGVRGVPESVRQALAEPSDLALILLGDTYLEACALDEHIFLGGATIALCGREAARRLPALDHLRPIALTTADARRFSCGLVGLKGELGARLLTLLARDEAVLARLTDPRVDLLSLIDWSVERRAAPPRPVAQPNPAVEATIALPATWWDKPHRVRLRYFIPDWEDMVDPDYDFATDMHSGGRGDWSNQVYAHQLYPEPNYDGLLVSRVVAESSPIKRERLERLGVHRLLRVPGEFPVMGDCGAFGYITAETPPYTTDDILDYYTRLGFTLGVSLDHIIVTASEAQKQYRYQLTIHNAEAFLREHRARTLPWEPVGAVQGWDPTSYAEAARQYVAMGYRYIGLGGLVRSSDREIFAILDAVHHVVPPSVQIHLFGIARVEHIATFASYGVRSLDSASMLRKAWLGTDRNYLTPQGWYSAIRVPQAEGSFRAKDVVKDGRRTLDELRRLEAACLEGLRRHAQSNGAPPDSLLDLLEEYDGLVAPQARAGMRALLRRTLDDRPWERCGCAICARWGIEVVIFRGNNRNRRRGFHNTHVFYALLQRVLAGEVIPAKRPVQQLPLFREAAGAVAGLSA